VLRPESAKGKIEATALEIFIPIERFRYWCDADLGLRAVASAVSIRSHRFDSPEWRRLRMSQTAPAKTQHDGATAAGFGSATAAVAVDPPPLLS
jgi:hypothetical protein